MSAKSALSFRIFLILLGWGGVCLLLYLYVFSPSTKNNLQTKPNAQKEPPKVASSLTTKSPPPTPIQQQKDPFQLRFSESEIEEAKEVVQKFVDIFYEEERTEREQFLNQLKPYITDSYLNQYRQANGLGEAIKIKEKYIRYIEKEGITSEETMGFHTVVITEDGDYFSKIFYLTKENDKWRIKEEGDGLVPEE